MAIFNNKPTDRVTAAITSGRAEPGINEAALSIIAAGMKIVGDIETAGILKIEGRVEGTIRGARQLLLGRGGEIYGDVNAREVILGGSVSGTITALERAEIQETSRISGDIYTKTIVVHEGAVLNGSVRMSDKPMVSEANGMGNGATAEQPIVVGAAAE